MAAAVGIGEPELVLVVKPVVGAVGLARLGEADAKVWAGEA